MQYSPEFQAQLLAQGAVDADVHQQVHGGACAHAPSRVGAQVAGAARQRESKILNQARSGLIISWRGI